MNDTKINRSNTPHGYVRSESTDIRVTFARIRAEQAKAAEAKKESDKNVRTFTSFNSRIFKK